MLTRRALGGLVATLPLLTHPLIARAQTAPEILARFPNGTFLENLVVEPDGSVLFTNYFDRRILVWSRAAGARRHADMPMHPVSLTPLSGGRQALVAHGAAFTAGPSAQLGSGAVLMLDPAGAITRQIGLPEAVFPNGAVLIAPTGLLVADSALGRIWAVDLATGTATSWLDDPSLMPVPGRPYPGANGIKRRGDTELLISNSATRTLLSLRVTNGRPQGAPAPVATMAQGVDDFALAPDGTIFAATHAEGIARLAPGATAPTLMPAPGLEGSTAVALTMDGHGLFVLGTGGLFGGGRGEAVLARLTLG